MENYPDKEVVGKEVNNEWFDERCWQLNEKKNMAREKMLMHRTR